MNIFDLEINREIIEPKEIELDDIENYDDNVVAIENHIEGINVAFEAIENLQRLKSIFNKASEPSASTIKIGQLALNNVRRSVNIFSGDFNISTECFKDNQVSLEGIVDMIKAIWDAIVRTFKAIWDKFASFFKSTANKKSIEKATKQIKQLKELDKGKLKESYIMKDGDNGFFSPFSHLGSSINALKLQTDLNEYIKVNKNTEDLSHLLVETNNSAKEFARALVNDPDSMSQASDMSSKLDAYMEYFTRNFKHVTMLDVRLGDDFDVIGDYSSLRLIINLVNDNALIAYQKHNIEDSTAMEPGFLVTVAKNKHINSHVKMEETTVTELSSYYDTYLVFLKDIEDGHATISTALKKIQNDQQDILKTFDKILNDNDPQRSDAVWKILAKTGREITKDLTTACQNVLVMSTHLRTSSLKHGDILSALTYYFVSQK